MSPSLDKLWSKQSNVHLGNWNPWYITLNQDQYSTLLNTHFVADSSRLLTLLPVRTAYTAPGADSYTGPGADSYAAPGADSYTAPDADSYAASDFTFSLKIHIDGDTYI